jgi:IclR family KDG regulon transcriptional repressor
MHTEVSYNTTMENNNPQPTKVKNQDNSSVQAVDRALTLLQLVANHNGPISIGALTEKANMNRTTVWRLLLTLEQHAFIERDPITKGYQVGYAASRLSTGRYQFDPLVRRARPSLERLSKLTKETVLLSVPKHSGTMGIYQLDPPHSVRLVDYVNTVLPLHCTSNGKILLSRLSNDELNIILQKPLEQVTPFTITDREQLRQEIEIVRQRGFGTAIGELDENENGISVPIVDKRNNLIAFFSVCGPTFRFTEEKALSLAPVIIAAAQEISDKLE